MKDNRTSVKRSLLVSAIALALTAALLIGTTFAWFTSTATTSVSSVTAGKLQVDIVDKNGDSLTDKTLSFKDKNGNDNILWEPGASFDLEPFKIVNKGNLAFKYSVTVSGATGDLDLLDAIDFTIKKADGTEISLADWNGVLLSKDKEPADQTTEEVGETGYITITGKMKDEATDIYQNKSISGISIHVDATQYTYEYDSNGKDYDQNATYPGRATIDGLVGEYSTLTDAAKAWRESKGITTNGDRLGQNNNIGTIDSITWLISGAVATGDGSGVVGSSGAIFGSGYCSPTVTVNNVTIKGVNGATILKTGDNYLVSASAANVVFDGITFVDTVRIDSNPANLTFKNCTFEAGFRMPHAADNANVTIENCIFTGSEPSGYAIFAQGSNISNFTISGNKISNCQRGINVQAGNNANVTISNNDIENISGKTENNFTYGSAIQLTSGKIFTVTNNKISNVAVNALHIYTNCPAEKIIIKDNNISAAYLCWNQANYDSSKVESSGNTVTVTNNGKCVTKTEVIDSSFALS